MFVSYKKYTSKYFSLFSGNILEFYDATLIGFLLPHICTSFLGETLEMSGAVGYLLLAASYCSRPLGAYLWGWIADVTHPTHALVGSVLLMALSTIGIGLVPNHTQIGAMAAIMLGFLRTLQGLSVGGEYGTATSCIYSEPQERRPNYAMSLLNASNFVGAVLACVVSFLVIYLQPFYKESWRFAFLISGIGGLLLVRKRLRLMKNRAHLQYRGVKGSIPFPSFVICMIVGGLTAMPYMFYNIYLTNEMIAIFDVSGTTKILINLLICLAYMLLYPFFGYVADRFGNRFNLRWGCLFLCLCGGVSMLILPWRMMWSTLLLQLIVNLGGIFYSSGVNTFIAESFPAHCRNRGITTSHTLGAALFGSGMLYFVALLKPVDLHYVLMGGLMSGVSLLVYFFSFVQLGARQNTFPGEMRKAA